MSRETIRSAFSTKTITTRQSSSKYGEAGNGKREKKLPKNESARNLVHFPYLRLCRPCAASPCCSLSIVRRIPFLDSNTQHKAHCLPLCMHKTMLFDMPNFGRRWRLDFQEKRILFSTPAFPSPPKLIVCYLLLLFYPCLPVVLYLSRPGSGSIGHIAFQDPEWLAPCTG